MSWEDLCATGGKVATGKKIDLKTLETADLQKRGDITGMPDFTTLNKLMGTSINVQF